jgi:hypothetical protein
MPNVTAPPTCQFSVYARHLDSHHARVLVEASFEAAAIAYAEDLDPSLVEGHAISVIVRELPSGHARCFQIDLDAGDVAPCERDRTN